MSELVASQIKPEEYPFIDDGLVINASNLHHGGGVQVAVSFIAELSLLFKESRSRIAILVSDEVNLNLLSSGCDTSVFLRYEVFNTYGITALWSRLSEKLKGARVVFSVFGPLYIFRPRFFSIVGFAQPWCIYPDNEVYDSLTLFRRILTRSQFSIQRWFFSRANELVVELRHVREKIEFEGFFDGAKVHVVGNCLSSIYFEPERWGKISFSVPRGVFAIGFVGRDYAHKNTSIIPEIKRELMLAHGLNVEFFVTFSDSEWARKSSSFRQNVSNVGSLEVAQCPAFYDQLDAVIFPSLLECFSATPFEAMAMGKPLFASDRRFVKDVCGDYAYYFDPLDVRSAARVISTYINNRSVENSIRLLGARKHVVEFSNASRRAKDYLEIMRKAVLAQDS